MFTQRFIKNKLKSERFTTSAKSSHNFHSTHKATSLEITLLSINIIILYLSGYLSLQILECKMFLSRKFC